MNQPQKLRHPGAGRDLLKPYVDENSIGSLGCTSSLLPLETAKWADPGLRRDDGRWVGLMPG